VEGQTQRKRRLNTSVIGANRHLQKTIEKSLYSLTRCTHYSSPEHFSSALNTDLVLYTLHAPYFSSLKTLIKCLEQNPGLPVIILAKGLDANHAVELIKCGVSDYIDLPIEHLTLRRKVERLLLNVRRPAIDTWTMLPFIEYQSKAKVWSKDANRRHCYRARTGLNMEPLVDVNIDNIEYQSNLSDISIKTDDWPGGMRLRLNPATQKRIIEEFQNQAYPLLHLNIHLPETDEPVLAQGRPIFRPQNAQGNFEEVVLQYQLTHKPDEQKMQSFWMRCQRNRL
jgi:DNA-binding response OmpR family regulator